MPIATKFFDAHPPLITGPDDAIPDRSDYDTVGELLVTGADMNRIVDPAYPWRDYLADHGPVYHQKILSILASRDSAVDHYRVTRRRFWKQVKRWHYGTDTQVTVVKHVGYVQHKAHIEEKTETATQRIAADLGINITAGGADVPGDVPPVPPVAMAAAGDGGNGGGGNGGSGVNLGLHFSNEMTRSLHITDTDESTFTDETTTSTVETFKGNTTYVYWQMQEECALEQCRKAAPDDPTLVYTTVAATVTDYTDAYPPQPDKGGGGDGNGDIH
jgi:hypothetical protein